MKTCPECNKEYPDMWTYCKKDGAELVLKLNPSLLEPGAKRPTFMADLPEPEVLESDVIDAASLRRFRTNVLLCITLVVAGLCTYGLRSWQLHQPNKPPIVSLSKAPESSVSSEPSTTSKVHTSPAMHYSGERFPQTRERRLTQADIVGWDFSQVRYAINEIYARHGYAFKDPDIRRRFKTFAWYRARPELSMEKIESDRMSPVERANAELLGTRRTQLIAGDHGE